MNLYGIITLINQSTILIYVYDSLVKSRLPSYEYEFFQYRISSTHTIDNLKIWLP